MKNYKIILFIGRENLEKDSHLYTDVFAKLESLPYSFFFDPSDQIRHAFNHSLFSWVPKFIKKSFYLSKLARIGIISFILCKQGIFDWGYLKAFRENPNNIDVRLSALLKKIKTFPKGTQITLIGRSAGAIIATKASLHFPIHQIICLAYPFKHPDGDDEPYRYEHLVHVTTPTLIIQGKNDPYGGREVIEKYPMNLSTKIIFEDLDHDFQLTEKTRQRLIHLIKSKLVED